MIFKRFSIDVQLIFNDFLSSEGWWRLFVLVGRIECATYPRADNSKGVTERPTECRTWGAAAQFILFVHIKATDPPCCGVARGTEQLSHSDARMLWRPRPFQPGGQVLEQGLCPLCVRRERINASYATLIHWQFWRWSLIAWWSFCKSSITSLCKSDYLSVCVDLSSVRFFDDRVIEVGSEVIFVPNAGAPKTVRATWCAHVDSFGGRGWQRSRCIDRSPEAFEAWAAWPTACETVCETVCETEVGYLRFSARFGMHGEQDTQDLPATQTDESGKLSGGRTTRCADLPASAVLTFFSIAYAWRLAWTSTLLSSQRSERVLIIFNLSTVFCTHYRSSSCKVKVLSTSVPGRSPLEPGASAWDAQRAPRFEIPNVFRCNKDVTWCNI